MAAIPACFRQGIASLTLQINCIDYKRVEVYFSLGINYCFSLIIQAIVFSTIVLSGLSFLSFKRYSVWDYMSLT